MSSFVYLFMAIIAEVVATTMLKASDGFFSISPISGCRDWLWYCFLGAFAGS